MRLIRFYTFHPFDIRHNNYKIALYRDTCFLVRIAFMYNYVAFTSGLGPPITERLETGKHSRRSFFGSSVRRCTYADKLVRVHPRIRVNNYTRRCPSLQRLWTLLDGYLRETTEGIFTYSRIKLVATVLLRTHRGFSSLLLFHLFQAPLPLVYPGCSPNLATLSVMLFD